MLDYTPRQAFAFLHLAAIRERSEAADRLYIAALASRAKDGEDISKQIAEWRK